MAAHGGWIYHPTCSQKQTLWNTSLADFFFPAWKDWTDSNVKKILNKIYFLPEEQNERGGTWAEFFIFCNVRNKCIHHDDWLLFLLQGVWVQTVLPCPWSCSLTSTKLTVRLCQSFSTIKVKVWRPQNRSKLYLRAYLNLQAVQARSQWNTCGWRAWQVRLLERKAGKGDADLLTQRVAAKVLSGCERWKP